MLSSSLVLAKDYTAGSSKCMSFLFLTTLEFLPCDVAFFFRLEQINSLSVCVCGDKDSVKSVSSIFRDIWLFALFMYVFECWTQFTNERLRVYYYYYYYYCYYYYVLLAPNNALLCWKLLTYAYHIEILGT